MSQIPVYCTKDCNAKTEIATPEKGLTLFCTQTLHFLTMLRNPSCTATYNLYMVCKGLQVIIISYMGGRKLNGNIGTFKRGTVKVLPIVNVNDAHYLMPSAQSYFFYHTAHFTVSDKRNFHFISFFSPQKY